MSRYLTRIAVWGLTALLFAASVRAGELSRPVPDNAQVTRFTRFNIRYRLRDIVAQGVQKVDFYITRDMGATWEYYGEDPDRTSPMTVEVPGEGVYGFICVVTDRHGNRERAPIAKTKPETVIVVDRTAPTAKWLAPDQDILGRGTVLELAWESEDEYFGPNPVKIQYAIDAQSNHDKNAKWFMVQENLPAKGKIEWTPPDSKKYNFRLVAEDRAGNAAIAYCAATVKVDNMAPYVVGVTPLRSSKLDVDVMVEAKDEDGGSGVKEISLYYSENGTATWSLVKEPGVGGDSVPVKRRPGDPIPWKAPKSGDYPLWPVVFDNAGNATPLPTVGVAGPFIITVDNEPPNVTLSNSFLMGGSSILSNQSRRVEWTSYDPHPKEGTTKILLSVDNGKNWQELATNLMANGFETVNFPFGAHGRECKLKVTVEDDFGNIGEAVSETFRLTGAQTTVDSVTPRRPTTDAAQDIFGSGDGGTPAPAGGSGGWFGFGGGAVGSGSGAEPPSLSTPPADEPSLPPLPPRGGAGSELPSLPALPGFGGDAYGGTGQDLYGGQSNAAPSRIDAVDWRTTSAAGPIPGMIVGNTLEPDPNAPGSAPGGLAGAQTSPSDEWRPSRLGGIAPSTAPEPSSYISGERMPWETDSAASTGLQSGLAGITPPGGGMIPPPPGGSAAASPWGPVDSAPQAPGLPSGTELAQAGTAGGTTDWAGGLSAMPLPPAPPSTPAPSVGDSMQMPLPTGSLRPPGEEDSLPSAPQIPGAPSGLPVPPLGGMTTDMASSLPALPGLPDATGQPDLEGPGVDAAMQDIFGSSDVASAQGGADWASGLSLPSTDSSATETAQTSDERAPLPWPARSSDLPPEAPRSAPDLLGLDNAPATGVFQPPPLQTTPGQRPVNRRQESEHYVKESKAFRDEGRPDLALASATKAVDADSTNAAAYMELSQVNARMVPPDHLRAANLAKEATTLDANWETWWNCADVFYIWAHACNRELQSMARSGQTPPVHLVDERNSTLSNASIAINNAASVMPAGDRDAAKRVGVTQGMITYLRALTIPEPANPGEGSGPAFDEYRRLQAQYKTSVSPLLQEAIPYFKNVLDMGGVPGYQETFQLGIIYFRLAGLERDTGNPQQASSNYQEAVRYLEQATTAGDTPKEGPREAYYMLALSHDQLADQPGTNRGRHKELALRYWRQTADFYDAGSAYRTYAEQRIEVLGAEMGL